MRLALGFVVLAVLAGAQPAAAETITKRHGPIALKGYEVARADAVFNIPTPEVDGFITGMRMRLVYEDGSEVPIANTMLHHVVMLNVGRSFGDRRDATCNQFRSFDDAVMLPALAERFYALGEERHELAMPSGYGYPVTAQDRWAMTYMLMNHLPVGETVFVEYTMEVETARDLKPITPVWMDVRNCGMDPVYDVPGGKAAGATDVQTMTWTAPRAGRVVMAGGHVHGGGRELQLRRQGCDQQPAFSSKPLWGKPDHPYYSVKPLLHEPGPVSMTALQSEQGIPVAAGETLELTSLYDAQRPHSRVMGILMLGFSPDDSVKAPCGPLPTDRRETWQQTDGTTEMPAITVPITGLGPDSKARVIKRPPGKTKRAGRKATVRVRDFKFQPANLAVRKGARVRWKFGDPELHNVSFANGPRAFSSGNLNGDRVFAQKLKTPGTYRLMCTLHPVGMAATVKVRRR